MKSELFEKAILLICFCIVGLYLGIFGTAALASEISMSDKRFLKNAAEAGSFEVEGSNLALKKSKNADIQKFARMMLDDHAQAAAKLKALATKKGVEVPSSPSLVQQGKLKYLSTKEGIKFDQFYISSIGVSAHESAVKLFEDAAEDSEDADVKNFAAATAPTLKNHLESAKSIDSKVNVDD